MKKIFFLFLILIFPINCFAYSDSANSSVVIDLDSGRILYEKNKDSKQLIASITKIMTCIIVLENCNLDEKVKVGEEILKMYGTNIYLELGEEIKVKDLVYGLMLRSGNDAAVVLANYVSGSEDEFVKLMNKKAKFIGMENTIFSNSHGLDEDSKNYSTAYDMALLSKYAFSNKLYREIISTKKYVTKSNLKSYIWYNRMKLLDSYKYCIGGKNGYTPKAGKTLVSIASKNDLNLSIVTLDDSDLYDNHKRLYDMIYSKYKRYEIISKDKFKVDKSIITDDIYLKDSFYYPLKDDEVDSISTFMRLNYNSKNFGEIIISLKDKEIGKIKVYCKKKKKKEKSLFQKIISEIS